MSWTDKPRRNAIMFEYGEKSQAKRNENSV